MGRGSVLVLTLVIFGTSLTVLASDMGEEKLIGWRGEMIDPESVFDPLNLSASMGGSSIPLPASKSWVEHISWRPRSFIYHNFITDAEAKHLIELAAPSMKRSTVIGQGGKSVEDDYRTSFGTFLHRYEDEVVKRIENRVAAWTYLPVEHQEDTQILRYGQGQFYKVHGDTFKDKDSGPRVATILIYLNEPGEGGETAFPDSTWVDTIRKDKMDAQFSECAKGNVAFKPKRGDALLFWSIDPDGTTEDRHAMHTGCPVISGVKWTATKWIHAKPFRPYEFNAQMSTGSRKRYYEDPGICSDKMKESICEKRAANGDCKEKADEMIVGAFSTGSCRKTCKACEVCAEGDIECYNKNRENVGYLVYDPTELAPIGS